MATMILTGPVILRFIIMIFMYFLVYVHPSNSPRKCKCYHVYHDLYIPKVTVMNLLDNFESHQQPDDTCIMVHVVTFLGNGISSKFVSTFMSTFLKGFE